MRLPLFLLASTLVGAPAFAADLGTYRPGAPYHSVIVPTANVCESQCAGDAQCRGWNYVKAAPQAPGVCEFQSSINAPIASAISISGVSPSAVAPSPKLIPGSTNTVRVGTVVEQTTPNGSRIVRRQPVPEAPRPPMAPPQGFQPALEGATHMARPAAPVQRPVMSRGPARMAPGQMVRPMQPRQMMPQPAPYGAPHQNMGLPPGAMAQPHRMDPRMMNSGVMAQPRPVGRPPVGQAIPQIQQQAVMPQQPPASAMMPRASANTPVSWTNAPQPVQPNPGLYGRLNDDVARAPAPVVNAPALQAPVVPVQPVQQMPLAGAVPR